MSRIERLAATLELPLLVSHPPNVRYLTGLESSNAALLVEPDGSATLSTDFRYREKAKRVPGVTLAETVRDLFGALGETLAGRRIGIEAPRLPYATYARLVEAGVDVVPVGSLVGSIPTGPVEDMRRIKDDGELAAMRRAAELSDRMFEALAQERFTGRTERELAWWIEQAFHDLGADGPAFSSIVASGENGASPHAGASGAVIGSGTLVTVDTGCTVDGYLSDCTRTFATGELPTELAEAYELCRQAQLDGLAAARAGVAASEVDAASRVKIDAAGLGDAYGHGLGHGVGLEIHEAPTMRPESTDVLEAGTIVTVEPGIYLPGVGGVRIEDLVLVTHDGCERLTQFRKELITVE